MDLPEKVNKHKRVYPRRLQAVVTDKELALVEKAAAIKGLSLSAFASKAAVASAKRVVGKEG